MLNVKVNVSKNTDNQYTVAVEGFGDGWVDECFSDIEDAMQEAIWIVGVIMDNDDIELNTVTLLVTP